MWYRTNVGGSYYFYTYNAVDGANGIGISVPADVTNLIPPMQAFWVRAAGTNSSLTFHNTDRAHKDVSNNILRSKAQKSSSLELVRLQVSNGVNSDETVLYSYPDATNQFDNYDSPKMSNGSASIPEIYTVAGNEKLVINGLNSIPYDTEIPLGFSSGKSGSFTINVSQLNNFVEGTQILLKDKIEPQNLVITDLKTNSYSFNSDITTGNTNRFALVFHAPSVASGIQPASNANVWISTQNGHIVVNGNSSSETKLEVFNAVGQKVLSRNITKPTVELTNTFTPGVYMVTITISGNKTTKKIIID